MAKRNAQGAGSIRERKDWETSKEKRLWQNPAGSEKEAHRNNFRSG